MTKKIRSTSHRASTAAVVAILLSITLSSCENALVEAAKAIQTEAVSIQALAMSPIIALTRADSTILSSGSNIGFEMLSLGSSRDIVLTIGNSGKSELEIDLPGITVTMGAGTEPGTFMTSILPPATIPVGQNATLTLSFAPTLSIGAKSATVVIPTNDVNIPKYTLEVTGAGSVAPTGLSGIIANHQVTITWSEVSSATGYNLYWSTTSNPTITTATKIDNVTSPYVHSGLPNNLNYYYILTALSTAGESLPSSTVTAMPMQMVAYVTSYYGGIKIYPIDSMTGVLGVPVIGPKPGYSLDFTVDKACKHAYLTDNSFKIFPFIINSNTGELTLFTGSVVTGSTPEYIGMDSTSSFVYVANQGPKNIMGYKVNADGSLSELVDGFPVSINEQLNGMSISPERPFLYVSTTDVTDPYDPNRLFGYSINTNTGALSAIGSPIVMPSPISPGPLSFDSTGTALYVTNRYPGGWSIDMYSYPVSPYSGALGTRVANTINWNGTATSIRNSDLAIDPLGRFLFVGGSGNEKTLTVFKINNGLLSVVPVDGKDSLLIDYEPGHMTVDTFGHCLYVQNKSKIVSYSINQTTGALTWLETTINEIEDSAVYWVRDITVVSLP